METERETEFRVVFNEVCKDDFYGLMLKPVCPTVILDAGANVGAFTSYARFLFPSAKIIAIEPDPRNFNRLLEYTGHLPGVEHIRMAIGNGPIWQGLPVCEAPYFGAVRSYVTEGQLGFPRDKLAEPPGQDGRDGLPVYEPAEGVGFLRLESLIDTHTKPDDVVLLKMDCEGGENYIFSDPKAMEALRRVDFITMETHLYTQGTGADQEANAKVIHESLMSLSDTHDCFLDEKKRHFRSLRTASNG